MGRTLPKPRLALQQIRDPLVEREANPVNIRLHRRQRGPDRVICKNGTSRSQSPAEPAPCRFEGLEPRLLLSTTFTPTQSLPGELAVAFADWNNDGQVEVDSGKNIFADYDNDGDLDKFHYKSGGRLQRNEGNGVFRDVSNLLPSGIPSTVSNGAVWGDFNGDSFVDIYIGGYEIWESQEEYPDALLMNKDGMSFELHWVQSSIRRARGISTADFDEDGDLDIYASNYRLQPNGLWVNDGKGNITDQAAAYGATGNSGHTIGSAWGDMDNDGHLDIFAANFSHAGQPAAGFLRNTGPSGEYKFQQTKSLSGPDWQESYASAALGDMDNDGDLDLFFTTVYPGDASRMYRNDGKWQFVNVTDEVNLSGLNPTYQAAWADIDNDGDLDLATAGRIYQNDLDNNNRWLKVRLEGDGVTVNRAAIGAQVRAFSGNETLTRQVNTGTGQGNQNDLTLHFGLGKHIGNVQLEVTWPGGAVQRATVGTNQTVTIRQGVTQTDSLVAQPIGPDSAFIYWSRTHSMDDGAISYELQYRKEDRSNDWSNMIATISSSAVIDGLDFDTAYRVRVRALEDGKHGDWLRKNNLFNTRSYKPETVVIGEVGNLTDLTHKAQTVSLNHSFDNPVVFAQSPSSNANSPITVRVSDVQADQFTIYLTEPSNRDGAHNAESVSYLVMESGSFQLADGRWLDVGTVDTNATVNAESTDAWDTVVYGTAFNSQPSVLTQIQTSAGAAYLHTRQKPGDESGFPVALQKEEADTGPNAIERIGYLAIEDGIGWSGLPFEAYTTEKAVTDNWYTIEFNQAYAGVPNLLSSLASTRHFDSGNLRYQTLMNQRVDVKIREDTTVDNETKHNKEKVSYLAIGGHGLILADNSNKPPTEPGPPSATVLGTDSALLKWATARDPDQDPITYKLQYRKEDASEDWSSSIVTGDTSTMLTGLEDGTAYRIRIQTSDGELTSEWVQVNDLFATDVSLKDTVVIGEVGQLTNLTHVSRTVTLNHRFSNPVVFAQSPSNHGVEPVAVRVSDVQPDRFSIYLAEPSGEDTEHKEVTVSYLVLESGSYELADGRPLEVGKLDTNASVGTQFDNIWQPVSYQTRFTRTPVVLTQVQTDGGADFLYTRQNMGSASEFTLALQGEEAAKEAHVIETVGYLAIEEGAGSSGLAFEAIMTSRKFNQDWNTLAFAETYAAAPNFLSSLATSRNVDSANLRYRKLKTGTVEVRVQEDTSRDKEVAHATEKVSYLAFDGDGEIMGRPVPVAPAAPSDPTGLSATLVGSYSAQLEWLASSDINGDPLTYEIQYRKDDKTEPWSKIYTTADTSLVLTGLDADRSYRVTIRATDNQLASDWVQVNGLFTTAPHGSHPVFTAADLNGILGYMASTSGDPAYSPIYDFDNNGMITASDLSKLLGYLYRS